MADLNNSETASAGGNQVVHPVEPAFILPGSLPKAQWSDGSPVKFGKVRKGSKRLGQRFNGKHND